VDIIALRTQKEYDIMKKYEGNGKFIAKKCGNNIQHRESREVVHGKRWSMTLP
jgi:hypothetical protein